MNSTQVVWASRLLLWMAGNMPRNASDKLQVSCSSTVLVTIYQTKYNHVLVLCNEVTSCCFATSLTKTLGSIISRINKLKTIFMCLFCYNLRSGVPIFFRGENKGTPDRRLLWWQCLSLGRLTDWWVQMSAIWMWMKPHIHLTGWEAILALRKRLKVIRKLPVSLISIEIIRYKSPLSSLSSKFYFLSIKFICHYHGSIEINLSKHFFTVMARHSLQALVTVVFCQVFL